MPNATSPASVDRLTSELDFGPFNPLPVSPTAGETTGWYLALEINLNGLSALLAHPLTGRSHAIYWEASEQHPSVGQSQSAQASRQSVPQRIWQLPTVAHLPSDFAQNEAQAPIQLPIPGMPTADGVLLRDLSPALSSGLSYRAAGDWRPQLHGYFESAQPQRSLPDPGPISLHLITRVLTQLLSTLNAQARHTKMLGDPQYLQASDWLARAEDLSPEQFQQIITQLEGVIVNCAADSNEAYRFNVREGILGAGLVSRPEQVAFLEDPITTLLAEFETQKGTTPHWQGATLVIHAGEAATELSLVCLPSGLHNLTHSDFKLRSFEYGEQAFKQDIACQLLTPFIPEEQLGLDLAILPIPGEPDTTVRGQLQRQLYRTPTGKMLLQASAYLQKALQQQERMTFEFGPYACTFSQTAMDTKVIQPFVLRLGRELHRLLQESELENGQIAQVLYSGSETLLQALHPWLEQMFPQAQLRERVVSLGQPSRITHGLAQLPLYAQAIDRSGQQYSDYFLLTEMLRSLPPEALTIQEIFSHLETQGINTQSCHSRILALLNGQLPAGLLPNPSDVWSSAVSRGTDYQTLEIKPLFRQLSTQSFQLDPVQRHRFLDYWQQITRNTHQTLAEPYILELGVTV